MAAILPPRSSGAASGTPVPSPVAAPDGGPPRQARARVTREAILDAAACEFAEAGYHGASLSAIMERSGVTKGALYFHFASKEAMAVAVVDVMQRAYRDVVDRVRQRDLDPLRTASQLALEVQDLLAGPACVRAGQRLAGEQAVDPERSAFPWTFWQSTFADLFARAREAGIVRADVDPLALGRFVVDISGGAFVASLAVSGMVDLPERVSHNWDLMFAATTDPDWFAGWRADGGMRQVMARHLGPAPAP